MTRPWLTVVGVGDNGRDGLTAEARTALENAAHIFAPARIAAHSDFAGTAIEAWPSPFSAAMERLMARRGQSTVVLATGDPMHYGIGATLARTLDPTEMRIIAAPSAFSLAAARLGWALQDTVCLSLHGRAVEGLHPHVTPGARILALTSDGSTVEAVGALLAARGYGASRLTVLGHMSGADETRKDTIASDVATGAPFDDFNTLAIDCVADGDAMLLPPVPGLDDAAFEHDGQLTKSAVRAVTLSALKPCPGALLWDVGAGCGSVAIEWIRAARGARAIAVERDEQRVGMIARNARNLGVPTLEIITGSAPERLDGLEIPDAIFIGGGLTTAGLFEACWQALKPGGHLVANAVTVESEARLFDMMGEHGGRLTRLSVSQAEPVGSYHGWRTAMPVTQWCVRKDGA